MAQSLSNVILHLVFSTKNRQPWIDIEIEEELRKYLAGTCRDIKCPSHKIGGSDDHLHIACTLARTMAISTLVEEIKTSSSKWTKTKGDRYADFAWQNGYGAFSISPSHVEPLREYIRNQEEHHRREGFQSQAVALVSFWAFVVLL